MSMPEVIGHIDDCRPEREVGSVAGRPILLPGDRVHVRGWARSKDEAPFNLEIIIDGRSHPLRRDVQRPDVTNLRDHVPCGFDDWYDVPARPGLHVVELRVTLVAGDRKLDVAPGRVLILATQPYALDNLDANHAPSTPYGRFRWILDADPRAPQHGWSGRRAMRSNSAIATRGWILDSSKRPPAHVYLVVDGEAGRFKVETTLVADGEATAIASTGEWFEAGFECILPPWVFTAGLYTITAMLIDIHGRHERGPSEVFQVIEAGEENRVMPAFLRTGSVLATSADIQVGPLDVIRGVPVVVRGSALDPSTGTSAPVYVRFGNSRPLPIPKAGVEQRRFAGIADTSDLRPGIHSLQILLEPAYAGFWHLVAQHDIVVRANPHSAETAQAYAERSGGSERQGS